MSDYKNEADLYPIVRRWLEDECGMEVSEQVYYGRLGGKGIADIVGYDEQKGTMAIEVKVSIAEAIPQALLGQDAFDYSYIAIPVKRLAEGWLTNYISQRELWALQQLGIGLFLISNENVKEVISARKRKRISYKRLTRKVNRHIAEWVQWQ